MDWKDSFERVTLLKGLQRYQDGQVGPIYKDGDIYVANVGINHLVEAQIQNGSIDQISCSCPAAQDGRLCSDEAAFLFALERSDLSRIPRKPNAARSLVNHNARHEPVQETWPGSSTRKPENHFRGAPRPGYVWPQAPEQHLADANDACQKYLDSISDIPMWQDEKIDESRTKAGLKKDLNPAGFSEMHPESSKGIFPEGRHYIVRKDGNGQAKTETPALEHKPQHGQENERSDSSAGSNDLDDLIRQLFGPYPNLEGTESKPQPSTTTHPQKAPFTRPDQASGPFESKDKASSFNPFADRRTLPDKAGQNIHPEKKPLNRQPSVQSMKTPENKDLPHDPFDFLQNLFAGTMEQKPESRPESRPNFHAPLQSSGNRQGSGNAALKPETPDQKPDSSKARVKAGQSSQPVKEAQPAGDENHFFQASHPAKDSLNDQAGQEFTAPATSLKPAAPAKNETVLTFNGLLDQISPAQLIKIVQDYCAVHPEFEDFIIARCAENYPEEAFELLQEQALSKLKGCLAQSGLFSPRQASLQAHSFGFWLADQVHALSEARQEARALTLIESVLVEMETGTSAEEESQIDILSAKAFELLEAIARTANASVKAELFSWIEEHLEKRDLPDFESQLISLVEKPFFNIQDLARLKLACLIQILDFAQENRLSSRTRAGIVKSALNLITDFPDLESEARDFEIRYGKDPEVMLEKARLALDHDEDERAEYLLKVLRHERLSLHQEETVCRLLIELYQKTGHPELAVRELKELIFTLQNPMPSDLSTLHQLESEEEWKEDLVRLENSADTDLLVFVYDRLHLDDKLLSALEKGCTITQLAQYEQRLAAVSPSRLAALWLKTAREQSELAADRISYRRTAAALQKAAQYEGTKEEAKKLADKIKSAHHRRHAFVQELERAGF